MSPSLPIGNATRPRADDEPAGIVVTAVSESRLRRWYREALLDAQLLGVVLVAVVTIGLVAAVV